MNCLIGFAILHKKTSPKIAFFCAQRRPGSAPVASIAGTAAAGIGGTAGSSTDSNEKEIKAATAGIPLTPIPVGASSSSSSSSSSSGYCNMHPEEACDGPAALPSSVKAQLLHRFPDPPVAIFSGKKRSNKFSLSFT